MEKNGEDKKSEMVKQPESSATAVQAPSDATQPIDSGRSSSGISTRSTGTRW